MPRRYRLAARPHYVVVDGGVPILEVRSRSRGTVAISILVFDIDRERLCGNSGYCSPYRTYGEHVWNDNRPCSSDGARKRLRNPDADGYSL